MLKRNLIIVAFISLSVFLTDNAFGQITNRKPAVNSLMKGHEGMQERKAASQNKKNRKITGNMDDLSGGNYRKKNVGKRKNYSLPEVNDEVLVNFRKKQTAKTTTRRKSNKYANQEVGYRTKFRRKKASGITHDPEFEGWANKKNRRKNK